LPSIPSSTSRSFSASETRKWVVDCRAVGSGEPALEYLSRDLYRGVIRERDLVDYDATAGTVTFRYRDGQTGFARIYAAGNIW
jgi:hypothetical protein